MKAFLPLFTFGVLLVCSCKKESTENAIWCGTGTGYDPQNSQSGDSTLFPPDNPDLAARIATVSEANGQVRRLYYDTAGLVDSVVGSGAKSYVQRFIHNSGSTLSKVYDAQGIFTGTADSILLNAAGAPTAFYELKNGVLQAVTFYTYNAKDELIVLQYNNVLEGTTFNFSHTWSGGNLVAIKETIKSESVPTYYSYHILKPAAPGEKQQLESLFKMGRAVKHSVDLRISERKETERQETSFRYRWSGAVLWNGWRMVPETEPGLLIPIRRFR